MTVSSDLRERADRFGGRDAVMVVDGPAMTFSEWDHRADSVGRRLAEAGVRRGDRVALLVSNSSAPDFHVGYVASHRAGAAAVPVNPRWADRELAHVLTDCSAAAVICSEDQLDRARQVAASLLEAPLLIGPGAGGPGELDWDELASPSGRRFEVGGRGGELAEILYTSGTTGLPKGVASTHDNSSHHNMKPSPTGGKLLHSIPLSSFTGLQGALLTPMRLGVTSVVLASFDTHRYAGLIESERPQWLLMVPAHILLLLEAGALEGRDLSSVAAVMFGGAPTPPAAIERLAALLPNAVLLNGYGLTEGGGSVCVLPPGEASRRPGSVGRPMSGVSLRLVDDDGEDVGPGQVGEIVLRMAAGERRYLNDPEATARTWRDGWVYTGDLGRLDGEGFLYLVDRKKDVIIRGGYNVASVEVESAIYEHPSVAEVAVLGIPHHVLGQDVCAVVRLHDGAQPLELEDLRRFLGPRLADYKLPRRLDISPVPLPRSAMGKVDKRALADQLEHR